MGWPLQQRYSPVSPTAFPNLLPHAIEKNITWLDDPPTFCPVFLAVLSQSPFHTDVYPDYLSLHDYYWEYAAKSASYHPLLLKFECYVDWILHFEITLISFSKFGLLIKYESLLKKLLNYFFKARNTKARRNFLSWTERNAQQLGFFFRHGTNSFVLLVWNYFEIFERLSLNKPKTTRAKIKRRKFLLEKSRTKWVSIRCQ